MTRRGQALFGGQSTCEIRPFNGTFTRENFAPFETEIERTHMGAAAPARGRSALVTAPMPRRAPRSTRPSASGALRVRACLWLPPQPPFSDAERASRAAGERESASAALLRPACALPTPGALRTSRCPVSPSELGVRACCANVPLQLEALAAAKRARLAPSAALEERRRAGVGTAPFLIPQRAARFIVLVPVHEQLLDVLIATFIDVLGVQRAIVGIDDLLLGVHDALEHGLRPGAAGGVRGGDCRRVLARAARRVRAWRMRAAPCASAEHREAGGAAASGRPPSSRTAPAAPVTAPRARCGAVFE